MAVKDEIDKFEVYMVNELNYWIKRMYGDDETFSYIALNIVDELFDVLSKYRRYCKDR